MAERNNGSAAYDFSRFEARTAQRPAPKNNVIELPQKAARPKLNFGRIVKRLLGIAVVLAVAGTLIVNQLQVNELNVQLQKAQKELGEKVGFSSKTADSRIRKYEKNIMAPKTEIQNKLADALDADLSALSDINIQTYEDVMHTLFLFEEEFDMDIDRTEEKTTLSFDNHNKKIAPLITYLYTWHCNKNLLFFMIFLL